MPCVQRGSWIKGLVVLSGDIAAFAYSPDLLFQDYFSNATSIVTMFFF